MEEIELSIDSELRKIFELDVLQKLLKNYLWDHSEKNQTKSQFKEQEITQEDFLYLMRDENEKNNFLQYISKFLPIFDEKYVNLLLKIFDNIGSAIDLDKNLPIEFSTLEDTLSKKVQEVLTHPVSNISSIAFQSNIFRIFDYEEIESCDITDWANVFKINGYFVHKDFGILNNYKLEPLDVIDIYEHDNLLCVTFQCWIDYKVGVLDLQWDIVSSIDTYDTYKQCPKISMLTLEDKEYLSISDKNGVNAMYMYMDGIFKIVNLSEIFQLWGFFNEEMPDLITPVHIEKITSVKWYNMIGCEMLNEQDMWEYTLKVIGSITYVIIHETIIWINGNINDVLIQTIWGKDFIEYFDEVHKNTFFIDSNSECLQLQVPTDQGEGIFPIVGIYKNSENLMDIVVYLGEDQELLKIINISEKDIETITAKYKWLNEIEPQFQCNSNINEISRLQGKPGDISINGQPIRYFWNNFAFTDSWNKIDLEKS